MLPEIGISAPWRLCGIIITCILGTLGKIDRDKHLQPSFPSPAQMKFLQQAEAELGAGDTGCDPVGALGKGDVATENADGVGALLKYEGTGTDGGDAPPRTKAKVGKELHLGTAVVRGYGSSSS